MGRCQRYRIDLADGTTAVAIMTFSGRGPAPAPCVARDPERCGRMSVALCDAVVGRDEAGRPRTCDAPLCERHRHRIGPNRDLCPRHQRQQALPLEEP